MNYSRRRSGDRSTYSTRDPELKMPDPEGDATQSIPSHGESASGGMTMPATPQRGDFVRVRTRRWLVEDERSAGDGLTALRLACVDDDAQGEMVEVLWDAELDGSVLKDEGWASVAKLGTDDPSVFSAYLRALRWNTATAADRDLFQAPFRAGIHQDAYQLLPLRKALRLPRVNLLIADDVGAGKTVEAGLVLREMLLRRRVDFVLVAAPAGMVRQWQDELEAKFGLSFTLIDREHLATLRRERGYTANPWSSGSRFIISHSLMADETYIGGLRDLLGNFRPRALFILDEAHHAAPASGSRYAVDSQFTRAVRGLAERFEHRLFLSATPHNGHSNSFSSLLEILDPQRFTRGVPVRPRELDAVMVRRLKSDLRYFSFLVRREAAVSSVSHSVRHETVRQDGGTDGTTLELAGRCGEPAGRHAGHEPGQF